MAFYFKANISYKAFEELRAHILDKFPQILVNDVYERETAHFWVNIVSEALTDKMEEMGITVRLNP